MTRPPTPIIVLMAVSLAVGAAWWPLAAPALVESRPGWPLVVALVVAAAVAERFPLRRPTGGPVVASTVFVGVAVLDGADPMAAALVAAGGYVLSRLPSRRAPRPGALLERLVGGWSLAGVAALGSLPGWVLSTTRPGDPRVVSLDVGAAALMIALLVVGPSLHREAGRPGTPARLGRRVLEAVSQSWMAGLAIASTMLVGALVDDVLGAWMVPCVLVPLFAARHGLVRLDEVSSAYDQTIRAMSRLPEQASDVAPDHGVRVGRLAVAVGLEVGLEADRLRTLEHAAHLHELGRVRVEGGRDPATVGEIARAGAAIVDETASMGPVAAVLAATADPAGTRDETALPARIVVACCQADRYLGAAEHPGRLQEMLVRLVREVGDVEVVSALSRVLERERALV